MTRAKQRQGAADARASARPSLPASNVCLLHPHDLDAVEGQADRKRLRQLPPEIGRRLREIRLRKNMTLSEIEALSGVSKSMLSQIERGRVNPTFARVWHLTRSLGVGVAELLGEVSSHFEESRQFEHVKVYRTPTITSSDGLCMTKILNPVRFPLPFEWYEVTLERGGALRANAHGNGAWEHMTVASGRVIVEIGGKETTLEEGETVRYAAEQPHGVRNAARGVSKVFLVLVASSELLAKGIPFGPPDAD